MASRLGRRLVQRRPRPRFWIRQPPPTHGAVLVRSFAVDASRLLGTTAAPSHVLPAQTSASAKLRVVAELIRPEAWLMGGGVLLLGGATSVSLVVPRAMGTLIDGMMENTGGYTSWEAAGLMLGLFALQSVMHVGRSGLMAVAGERFAARLRKRAFGGIIGQDTAFFDLNKTGDLVNRLASDILLMQKSVTGSIPQGLRSVFLMSGSCSMLLYLSPYLAATSLCVFPPAVGVAVFMGRRMKGQQRRVQEALAASSALADEVISSIRTVRMFSAEGRELARYSQKVDESYSLARRIGLTNALFEGAMNLGGSASLVAVMAVGGQQVAEGSLSIGGMTSFLLYSTFLAGSFAGVSSVYSDVMRAMGAGERVLDIMLSAEQGGGLESTRAHAYGDRASGVGKDHGARAAGKDEARAAGKDEGTAAETLPGPAPGSGALRFEGVHFSYPARPEVAVLTGLTLHVEPGTVLAIVGSSGSGKSTLLRLLTRLYDPQEGVIEMDGVSLKDMDPRKLRDKVGVVEQEPVLFGGSVGDNIRYGRPEASDEEVVEAAKVANAHAFIEAFPEGYGTLVGEHGVQMSGGQKQRIAVARAVLKNPAVMVLDEATSALDGESEHLVQAALERVARERVSLVIAHRLSTVRSMSNQVAVLEGGQVVELGSYDDLLDRPDGRFRRMVAYQMPLEAVPPPSPGPPQQ